MKIDPRCSYCLLSRVHFQCRLVTDDPSLIHRVMKECMETLSEEYEPTKTSTAVGTAVHRKCFEVLQNHDPYQEIKKINTKTALEILPAVQKMIYGEDGNKKTYTAENSPLPLHEIFEKVVLAAVIGNYFDFGVMGMEASDEDFKQKFKTYFEKGLQVNETREMMKRLQKVVYITDNCGEIVFDREVLKVIRRIQKTQYENEKQTNPNAALTELVLIVRGAPILTDATLKDAYDLGMEKIVDQILTTGSNAVGIILNEAPEETIQAMKNATLIIGKGMANYESLSNEKEMRPIAYLLRTKCEAVAESIGTDLGNSIAKLEF